MLCLAVAGENTAHLVAVETGQGSSDDHSRRSIFDRTLQT